MSTVAELERALRTAIFGRHLRELHFYFGTLRLRDIIVALASYARSDGDPVRAFERAFAARFGVVDALSFGAGRMALYAILEAAGIGEGAEVIVPGFTCVVVPNAVRYRRAIPVFVDIDPRSWNIDPERVASAITPTTRAVIVQHTFGVPADIDTIGAVAQRHGLLLVEDCAHVLGGQHLGRPLGTFGDAAFFSFESSKPLTLGRGGMAIARDQQLLERLRAVQRRLPETSGVDDLRAGIRLLVLTAIHRPEVFRLGKFVAGVLFRGGVFHPNISRAERCGLRPKAYPVRLTRFQALLGVRQLERLDAINAHRSRLTALYRDALRELGLACQADAAKDAALPLLRCSLTLRDTARAVAYFAEQQIELGRWFDSPVAPVRLDDPELPATGYFRGSCPVAEHVAQHCANLPTDPVIGRSEAARILATLRRFLTSEAEDRARRHAHVDG